MIVLRYTEGLSYEEIANIIGCSPGTVASRLNRAHKILRIHQNSLSLTGRSLQPVPEQTHITRDYCNRLGLVKTNLAIFEENFAVVMPRQSRSGSRFPIRSLF